MNEMFAAEPVFAQTATELKLFLNQFGPTTGRYVAAVPRNWQNSVVNAFAAASPMEQKRVTVELMRAKSQRSVVLRPDLPWVDELAWRANAAKLTDPSLKMIEAAVVAAGEGDAPLPGLVSIDQLHLEPTTEEEMETTPENFDRVCRMVIALKGDLNIVDPYLDPCRVDVKKALLPLIRRMGRVGTGCLTIWSRAKLVLHERCRTANELRDALASLQNGVPGQLRIRLNLLKDQGTSDRMHARYLFSVHAGVAIDNGFQILPGHGRTKVSPMAAAVLDAYIRRYQENLDHAPVELSVVVGAPQDGPKR